MFWPGEELKLEARAGGSPLSVVAQMLGYPGYSTVLKDSGRSSPAGEKIYTGELWQADMFNRLAADAPIPVTVRFTAYYGGGSTLTYDVPVIFMQGPGALQLHRYY